MSQRLMSAPGDMDSELHPGYSNVEYPYEQQLRTSDTAQRQPRKDSIGAVVTEIPAELEKPGNALPPVTSEAQARPLGEQQYMDWESAMRQQQQRRSYIRNDPESRDNRNHLTRQPSYTRQLWQQTESYDDRKARERDEERRRIRRDYDSVSYDPRGSYRNSDFFTSPLASPSTSVYQRRQPSLSYQPTPTASTSDFGRYPAAYPQTNQATNNARYPSISRRSVQQRRQPQRQPSSSSDSYTSDE